MDTADVHLPSTLSGTNPMHIVGQQPLQVSNLLTHAIWEENVESGYLVRLLVPWPNSLPGVAISFVIKE